MKKQLLILTLLSMLLPSISYGQTNADSIKQIVKQLETAILNKDLPLLKTCLASDFSISVASLPAAERYLDPMLTKESIKGVEFLSMQEPLNEKLYGVNVVFTTAKNEKVNSIIAFDAQNKIYFVDYFDRLYGHSRYAKSEEKQSIPFAFNDGHIVLSIKLNDSKKTLRFLLDTGADGMAITKSLADSLKLNIGKTQNAKVVGGSVEVEISTGNTVHLSDSFALTNQNIAVFNNMRDQLDGIIGLNIARNYITKVDFDKMQITLSTFGDYAHPKGETSLAITTPHNVMIVPGSINIVGKKEVEGAFVFDTGANYHFIAFSSFVRKNRLLLTGFKPEETASTSSMGVVTPVFKGKASEFNFGHVSFSDLPVTLQASSGAPEKGIRPDGSIGVQLISKFNFTIDMLSKTIHLQARDQKLD